MAVSAVCVCREDVLRLSLLRGPGQEVPDDRGADEAVSPHFQLADVSGQ